ncbi:MAG TPA: DEAD/DEAH box helicase [Vicinamibacterales bacterium]|nr:DEAD/DEAH box helicase [Vicinamibacterales bacterium]
MTRPADAIRFDSLGLADSLISSVTALGYEEPTPIQREAIPLLLAGRDLFGQAGTGTGKTAAFALPLLHRLATTPAAAKGATRALILVPTRELAMQVAEAIHKYARKTSITVVPVYGGAPMHQQIRALSRGADVVVATPGRALDHLRRQTLALDRLEVLVLDEADEMLDMGFAEDLETILKATPPGRQTALFAATMAPRIGAIAERHMRKPARVEIKGEKRPTGAVPRVRQSAYVVSRSQKGAALGRILEFEDPASAIVFCRTRLEVDELTETLLSHGYGAQALHGGMEQKQRDRVMNAFRSGKADVLVATDVAARGLDIEHVSHVINFDIPTAPEVYVHRIGRTGRAGRDGVALTLVDPREQRFLRHIEGLTRQQISILPLPSEAALRAKRIDSLRLALTSRIEKGELDGPRSFVTELAHDVDLVDIAAAAVALLAESDAKDAGGSDAAPARGGDGLDDADSRLEAGVAPMTTLFIGAGRSAGIRPGDIVGAIAGEAHLTAKQIGGIKIGPHHSLVEVPEALADRVIAAMGRTKLRGKKVEVTRAGDGRRSRAD